MLGSPGGCALCKYKYTNKGPRSNGKRDFMQLHKKQQLSFCCVNYADILCLRAESGFIELDDSSCCFNSSKLDQ